MRPVALVSPQDPRAHRDEFTYLLGEDLLVAPVVDPGARERRLFVPAGEWVDWWDGRRYRGPAVVTVPAPLDRIPLLVRAGRILPLADPSGSLTRGPSAEAARLPLVLRVHPASSGMAESSLRLYDGARIGSRQVQSGQLTIEISGGPGSRPLTLSLADPEPPRSVRSDGGKLVPDWRHDPAAGETTIAIPAGVTRLTIIRRL